jgi:Protein kinase domain
VDVWSVACIILEMSRRSPIFPGTDPLDQLFKIFRLLGTPVTSPSSGKPCIETYWPELSDETVFGDMAETFPQWYPHSWDLIADKLPPAGQELIAGMLVYNPKLRLSAGEALNSKYLAEDVVRAEVTTPFVTSDYSDGLDNNMTDSVNGSIISSHINALTPVELGDITHGSGGRVAEGHVFLNVVNRNKRKYVGGIGLTNIVNMSVNEELTNETVNPSIGTNTTDTLTYDSDMTDVAVSQSTSSSVTNTSSTPDKSQSSQSRPRMRRSSGDNETKLPSSQVKPTARRSKKY